MDGNVTRLERRLRQAGKLPGRPEPDQIGTEPADLVPKPPHLPEQAARQVEQVRTEIKQGQYEDEQGIRQRYQDLRQRQQSIEQQLASWKNFFKRGELQRSLDSVQRDLRNYETQFRFVLTPPPDFTVASVRQQELAYQTSRAKQAEKLSYLGSRQDAVNKAVAISKADMSFELAGRETNRVGQSMNAERYRVDAVKQFTVLQQLLKNRPKRGAAYDDWYKKCNEAEGSLHLYSQSGQSEQLETARYWLKKLTILEDIKPMLFGRAEWQRQHDRAKRERAIQLRFAKAKPSE